MNNKITENKIGIIGAGNIGQSLIIKLLKEGYPEENIKLTYRGSIFTFEKIYDNNLVDMISDNSRIVEESDILILSVPPQAFKQIGDFGLKEDNLVISFMAGISIDEIKKQTGSDNVVRVMPTGPDTILDSNAIAGVYPENDDACELLDLLDIDYYILDMEDDMKYMTLIGCLPAVYCVYDYESVENKEVVDKFSKEFPLFKELSYKASLLVPNEDKEEFVKKVATPGGVTQKILFSLDNGESFYDSLVIALDYIDKLNDMIFV
ncbi:pyrroline-5-carboxylate reductase [Methanosphaera sp. BMS]|uniref:pyrroline-5-carboxylate reductase family protein n=1 Tax=Methanosphaera sp. BMS TaxID=1789762 RepID=UPI000DC1F04B|nr:NAD(P)-binding domain-containing protein [Methanosphaera sp. BMS]AWX33213.1 hypothetical protein AW729_08990 [Methanosphaera sp. BMS]